MQLYLLMLMLAIVLHDQFEPGDFSWPWHVPPAPVGLALWLGFPLLALGIYAWFCRATLRQLGTPRGGVSLRRLERLGALLRTGALVAYLGALSLGTLSALRRHIGDWIMVDELVMIGPALLLMIGMWAAYYPMDRRIRQASLIGRIDAGLPIYPIWTLPQFLLAQVRHQILLLGVPLFLILAWQETLANLGPAGLRWIGGTSQMAMALAGSGGVFLLAPVLIRHLWDTAPLSGGELRDALWAMCGQYRVRVREILLWRTFGGLTNAAVMGILGPVRFVLLSDALLDMLPRRQVEAVMAHELAHIRKHHILSLVLAALAILEGLSLLAQPLFEMIAEQQAQADAWALFMVLPWAVHACVAGGWVGIFGWVSRRFERQADTFAVQHLARQRGETAGTRQEVPPRMDPESVLTMILALQAVADANHMPVHKPSWRHGSIAWRQAYLRSLVGTSLDDPPIDRTVRWIQSASLLTLLLAGAWGLSDTIKAWLAI